MAKYTIRTLPFTYIHEMQKMIPVVYCEYVGNISQLDLLAIG